MRLLEDQNWLDTIVENQGVPIDRRNPANQIQPEDGMECGNCFCSPCVINERHRQDWWPSSSQAPHQHNNKERKRLYYKFWVMLYQRGAWANERYIARKETVLEQHDGYVQMRRELMPDCVVDLVRTWYPNLPGQPYLGHRWS